MTTESTTTETTDVTSTRAHTPHSRDDLDAWRWAVRHLWHKRCDAKGADAFRIYVELASIMLNTAACSTAHKEQQEDGTEVFMDEAGIDPLLRRLVQNANDLLYLVRKALDGEEIP